MDRTPPSPRTKSGVVQAGRTPQSVTRSPPKAPEGPPPSGLEYIFQNAWKTPGSVWLMEKFSPLTPDSERRATHSDATGLLSMSMEHHLPPGNGTAWLDSWEIDISQEECGKDGWVYGANFAELQNGEGTPTHDANLGFAVRRRRWRRHFGPPGTAPPQDGDKILDRKQKSSPTAPSSSPPSTPTTTPRPPNPFDTEAPASATTAATTATAATTGAATTAAVSPPAQNPHRHRERQQQQQRQQEAQPPQSATTTSLLKDMGSLGTTLPLRADTDVLTPTTLSSDLEAISRALQVLRRGVAAAGRGGGGGGGSTAALGVLSEAARVMGARLGVLERVCKKGQFFGKRFDGSQVSAGGGAHQPQWVGDVALWTRLSGETQALGKAVGEEVGKLGKVKASAAAAVAAAAASGEGGGGKQGSTTTTTPSARELQAQMQMSEADWALMEAEERGEEIMAIAQSTVEVHDLFKDVAHLVEEQTANIEKLEANTADAAAHTEKGLDDIRAARAKQRATAACAIV